MLNASSEYGVEVMVIDANGLNNSAAATVVVGRSALIAVIAGGDRIVGISEENLALDASGSYDPDSANTALTVVWSCAVLKENNWDPGVCGGNLTEDATISQRLAAYGAGTYSFSAFVVSADGRNTTTSVVIEVRGGSDRARARARARVCVCVCVWVCVCLCVAHLATVGSACTGDSFVDGSVAVDNHVWCPKPPPRWPESFHNPHAR